SQADGAGDTRDCGAWPWHGFYAVFPVGVLFAVAVAWFTVPALAELGPSPCLQALAADYTHMRVFGELGYLIFMVLGSFFIGLGDTRTPLYVTIFAIVVNAILDYALIFGKFGFPALGVAGAGLATAIAMWTSPIVLIVLFQRRSVAERCHTRPIAPNMKQIRRFLKTSAPIGGHWSLSMFSFAVFTTLVARMGDNTMAASQAFVMLQSMAFMQAEGIATASATLVGRFIGSGDRNFTVRSHLSSVKLGVVLAALVAAVFIAIPVPLLRIFTDDLEVVALGRPLLLLGACFAFPHAVAIITAGSLRGAGDTRWVLVLETALSWGLFLPAAYILGIVLEGGLIGAWSGMLLHITVLAAVLSWRFRSDAWQQIQI
ncbi:MAG: MATE family efflux transporter, partial [Myxococcales bacterium]|nr:MATE family efflux transporter [Myxococcales bacterium]